MMLRPSRLEDKLWLLRNINRLDNPSKSLCSGYPATLIHLVSRYKLTRYEIERVLPKADTLQTSIGEVCPDFASPIQCHPKLYRRIDGLCNNVRFPNWGATRRQFQR